ncbi:MAG: phosphatase PAP2 family protein [Actinobacteria bacterium]|nr:phosphatase PAP2 family protein [Actinomycetota bacterium]
MSAFFQFLTRLDYSIFHALNSIAGRSSVLDWFIRVGADDHIIPVVLTLLVLLVILLARDSREREAAAMCLICAVAAVVISVTILFALNSLFFRPRPFTTHSVNLLLYHNTDSAFPSNAATLAFALSFAVLFYHRKVGLAMLALGTFLGLARVAAGVHYPMDILGGILLGLASACFARLLEPLYRPAARWFLSLQYRLLTAWEQPAFKEGVRR